MGDAVLLHTPQVKPGESRNLASPWKSGYRVIDKFGQVNYYIEHEKSQKRQLVHIDRLKLRRARADTREPRHSALPTSGRKPSNSGDEGWWDAVASPHEIEDSPRGASSAAPPPAVRRESCVADRRRAVSDAALANDVRRPHSDIPAATGTTPAVRSHVPSARGGGESGRHRVFEAGEREEPERVNDSEATTPEPGSGTVSSGAEESDTLGSSEETDSVRRSMPDQEADHYARITNSRRYPERDRRAPVRFSP